MIRRMMKYQSTPAMTPQTAVIVMLAESNTPLHSSMPAVQNTVKKAALHFSQVVAVMAFSECRSVAAIMNAFASPHRERDHA